MTITDNVLCVVYDNDVTPEQGIANLFLCEVEGDSHHLQDGIFSSVAAVAAKANGFESVAEFDSTNPHTKKLIADLKSERKAIQLQSEHVCCGLKVESNKVALGVRYCVCPSCSTLYWQSEE